MKRFGLALMLLAGLQMAFAQVTRDMGSFHSLSVYDKIPVILVKSDKNSVEVSGDKASNVQLVNKNGTLKIRMDAVNLMRGDDVKVKVYYSNLIDIRATQGSVVTSERPMDSRNLTITSNEGSRVDLSLDGAILEVRANSGGQVTMKGSANNQTVVLNTGGSYDGGGMKTKHTSVTVNAGGNAEVYAKDAVVAKTRAGGNITILGNPVDRTTKKVAGGNITFE